MALLDLAGHVVASHSDTYDLITPRPGWAEQDPDTWWAVALTGIRHVLKQADVRPGEILAIGGDAQMHATVPLGSTGELLSHGVQLWCDKRGADLVETIKQHDGVNAAMRHAADPLLPAWVGFKMRWLKEFAPEQYRQTWQFVNGQGYINYRLTGVPAMDWSEASGSFLLDAATLTWSRSWPSSWASNLAKLPPVLPSTAVSGYVTAEARGSPG